MSHSRAFHVFCLLSCGAMLALTGCGRPAGGGGNGVALIDIERVAQGTGNDQAIRQAIEQVRQREQNRIDALRMHMQEELNKVLSNSVIDSATRNQRINDMRRDNTLTMQMEGDAAQKAMNQARDEALNKFREKISPIALKVATASGKSVVIIINGNNELLTYDPSANITDEVITEVTRSMSGSQSTATPPPAMPGANTGPMPGAAPAPDAGQAPSTRP